MAAVGIGRGSTKAGCRWQQLSLLPLLSVSWQWGGSTLVHQKRGRAHTLFNLGQLQRFDKKVEGALLEGSPYQGCTGILRHEEDARITLTGLKCRGEGGAKGFRA